MATIATLAIRLEADTSHFRAGLSGALDLASRATSSIGGGFLSIGNAVLGFGAIAAKVALGGVALLAGAVTGIGVIALKEAIAGENAVAALEAVLAAVGDTTKITSQQAQDLAMSYRDLAKGSNEAVLAAETILLRYSNLRGDAFEPALKTTLDLAAALGIDAASAAKLLGRALELPGEGMRALIAAGIVLDEKEKERIDRLVESGQIAKAQKLLMEALAGTIGGTAARMADTLSGRLTILKAHLLANAQTIGNALIPFIEDLVKGAKPLIDSLGEKLPAFLEQKLVPALQTMVDWLKEKVPIAIDFLRDTWEKNLIPALDKVRLFWETTLKPAFEDFREWLEDFLPQAMRFLSEHSEEIEGALLAIGGALVAGGIVAAIAGIVGAIASLVTPVGAIIAVAALLGAAWAGNWGGIREKTAEVWGFLKTAFEEISTWLQINIPKAIDFLKMVWETRLKPIFEFWAGLIKNVLVPVIEGLVGVSMALLKKEIEILSALWENVLQPALKKVWEWLAEKLGPVFEELGLTAKNTLGPALLWLLDNVITPVTDGFGGIIDIVKKVVGWLGTLADKISGIKVPSSFLGKSPSPFEMSLLGINDALKRVAQTGIPDLAMSMSTVPQSMGQASGMSGFGGPVTIGDVHFNVPQGMNGRQLFDEFMTEAAKRTREARASGAGTVGI